MVIEIRRFGRWSILVDLVAGVLLYVLAWNTETVLLTFISVFLMLVCLLNLLLDIFMLKKRYHEDRKITK